MLASFFMKPADRDTLEKLSGLLSPFFASSAAPDAIGDVVDDLRAQQPLSGAMGDMVRFIRRILSNEQLSSTAVQFVLGAAEKRGIAPEALGRLLKRLAPYLKLNPGESPDTADIVKSVLTSLADREIEADTRIGAVCTCPSCNYTYFI